MTDEEFWDRAFFATYEKSIDWRKDPGDASKEPPESYRPRWAAMYADCALRERRKFREKEEAREESGYRKAPPKAG